MRVCVIGAGAAGLLSAHYLHKGGIEHVVYEQTSRPGGTWVYEDIPEVQSQECLRITEGDATAGSRQPTTGAHDALAPRSSSSARSSAQPSTTSPSEDWWRTQQDKLSEEQPGGQRDLPACNGTALDGRSVKAASPLDSLGLNVHSSMYRDLRTNLPIDVMAYPGFPFPKGTKMYPHHTAVRAYFDSFYESYVAPYGNVRFRTKVIEVRRSDGDDCWLVTTVEEKAVVPHASPYHHDLNGNSNGCNNNDNYYHNNNFDHSVRNNLTERNLQNRKAAGADKGPAHDNESRLPDGNKGRLPDEEGLSDGEATSGAVWQASTNQRRPQQRRRWRTERFSHVLVCNGTYTVPRVPPLPGLGTFRGRIEHSHTYRTRERYAGLRVLVVGAGYSGVDIAIELATVAARCCLVNRGSPLTGLPTTVVERGPVATVRANQVEFADGQSEEFDVLMFCTGYRISAPFLESTNVVTIDDGFRIRDLFRHCILLTNPTLAFIGLPNRSVPCPTFDYQIRYAIGLFTGRIPFPTREQIDRELAEDRQRSREQFGSGWDEIKFAHDVRAPLLWAYWQRFIDDGLGSYDATLREKYEASFKRRARDFVNYRDNWTATPVGVKRDATVSMAAGEIVGNGAATGSSRPVRPSQTC